CPPTFRGPRAFFERMTAAQGGGASGYGAFIEAAAGGRWAIASASPELFFSIEGGLILCRPMKGTAPRGSSSADDRPAAASLRRSEKDRAENVMIVDMIRNDLGRIARRGAVKVVSLFDVERYPTVWQMTSTIEARADASFVETMSALFPAASITGAPKV